MEHDPEHRPVNEGYEYVGQHMTREGREALDRAFTDVSEGVIFVTSNVLQMPMFWQFWIMVFRPSIVHGKPRGLCLERNSHNERSPSRYGSRRSSATTSLVHGRDPRKRRPPTVRQLLKHRPRHRFYSTFSS